MTSATDRLPAGSGVMPAYRQPQRVTQVRVIRSEWTKLRTQPSAFWALLSAGILVVGFGIGYSLLRVARPPRGAAAIASFAPTAISLSGVQLAQIAVGVLGVLLVTSEYATGLIRTTFAAVPRRLPVLWSKAALLVATATAVYVPAPFAAFLGGQSILRRQQLSVPVSEPGVVRAVIGSALYLAVIGLVGLGWAPCCATRQAVSPCCSACCTASRWRPASCRATGQLRWASTCQRRPARQ